MPLKHFIKTIFQPSPTTQTQQQPPLDGEIVYSKNNVCVHPQGLLASTVEHYPGYLTIFAKVSVDTTSLVLNWIPNTGLKHGKNPVQDDIVIPMHCKSHSCTNDMNPKLLNSVNTQSSYSVSSTDTENELKVDNSLKSSKRRTLKLNIIVANDCDDDLSDASISSGSTEGPDANTETDVSSAEELDFDDLVIESRKGANTQSEIKLSLSSLNDHEKPVIKSKTDEVHNNQNTEHSFAKGMQHLDITTMVVPLPVDSSTNEFPVSPPVIHNMQFPENSISFIPSPSSSCGSSGTVSLQYRGIVKRPAKDQACGVFTVDLGLMRSLRLFFSNDVCNSGQLVIASQESQYKILHFHRGGLDALADILGQWKLAVKQNEKISEGIDVTHFSICGPQLSLGQCNPEEGLYKCLSADAWSLHINEFGQIEEEYNIRKAVYFGGMDPQLRSEVWLFLLKCYPFSSTYDERQEIKCRKDIEYQDINTKRMSMSHEEQRLFARNVACIVEKDVFRTDRANPFYKGDNNPNLHVLRHILLNYAVHANTGYTQGMSDLLSPLLIELKDEAETFWCFVGLMQRTIFISSPKDEDMERQLMYLRELLRLTQPQFYEHLKNCGQDAMELLFVHRWILLCFKREFIEHEALMMWESCWAHYQTDYFHLFICVAIIAIYGTDVVENKLASDEMLLHFSNLAMQMNGHVVLRKARGLLHYFRVMPRVPCTLHDICMMSPPGVWDSGYAPTVECTGIHESDECMYGGSVTNTSSLANAMKKGDMKIRDFFK